MGLRRLAKITWPHSNKTDISKSIISFTIKATQPVERSGATDGEPRHEAGQVPRRVELRHQAEDVNEQFLLARRLRGAFDADFRGAKSTHIPHGKPQRFSRNMDAFCAVIFGLDHRVGHVRRLHLLAHVLHAPCCQCATERGARGRDLEGPRRSQGPFFVVSCRSMCNSATLSGRISPFFHAPLASNSSTV